MNILYDHQIFLVQKYGGISKYFCELIKHSKSVNSELSVLISDNQHLKDDYNFFHKKNISIPDFEFPGKSFLKKNLYNLNRAYCKSRIKKNNFDILHPTYFDSFFLKYTKKPYVVTVHDLIDFKIKEPPFKDTSRMLEITKIVKSANGIIAISENTKKDLIDILKIEESKIKVVYHGYSTSSSEKNKNNIGRYILFVGSRWGYKNFLPFVKAVSRIFQKDKDLKLVCVGLPFSNVEKQELKNLEILHKTFAVGANEKELNSLYANALVFVYPTLYEGFGMPILEAFSNNCPICISNTSSLPEIAQDAAVYFDPYDTEELFNAIEKVIYNQELSNQLIEAGRRRLQDFSWEKCSQQTTNVYKSVL